MSNEYQNVDSNYLLCVLQNIIDEHRGVLFKKNFMIKRSKKLALNERFNEEKDDRLLKTDDLGDDEILKNIECSKSAV